MESANAKVIPGLALRQPECQLVSVNHAAQEGVRTARVTCPTAPGGTLRVARVTQPIGPWFRLSV